jgi:hypothetical protein
LPRPNKFPAGAGAEAEVVGLEPAADDVPNEGRPDWAAGLAPKRLGAGAPELEAPDEPAGGAPAGVVDPSPNGVAGLVVPGVV